MRAPLGLLSTLVRAAVPLAFAASLIPQPAAAQQAGAESPVPAKRIILQDGFDLPGGDLAQLFNSTLADCLNACRANEACTALTYNTGARACFPKGAGAGAPLPFGGALSGTVALTPADVIARAADRAGSADWLRPADIEAAREQALRLSSDYPGAGQTVEALRDAARQAAAVGDGEGVIRAIAAATAMSDAPADWLSLSQWLTARAREDDATSEEVDTAFAAALNAWLRDPGPGSAAIRSWAELSEKRDRGRDGLKALRQAAVDDSDPDLQQMLDQFAERYGFRVTDNSVDADAAAPRACAILSEELSQSVDYRQFVTLPDQSLAVEAEGSQLCVTGIAHGAELALTLRAGLPAASGEVLARDVPVSVYVRDRTPLARFSGRAYLLPAGGDQALTVQTVNTDKVALTLYSMSDRNIVQALRDEIFGLPISGWKAEEFTAQLGTEIWSGEADVAPTADGSPRPVNEEVSTALSIAQAAGPLPAGVYALTASVPGQDEDRSPAATQWFMISDLGMTSFSGSDGLTVAVRGIGDAAARAGVRVQLVSSGNAVLGTTVTDEGGIARFEAGLTRGRDAAAPAMVTAAVMEGDAVADMAFLSLTGPEFDLSDRGVEGLPSPGPIDIFAATDRGAYRVGETVHATILARDDRFAPLPDLPLTAIISRPDGVELTRMLVPAAGDGGHVLDWTIPATAPRGGWTIDLKVDVEAPALATMRVLVEDFRPERLDLTPEVPAAPLATDAPLAVGLTARWLYGAPGAELPVEGSLNLERAAELPGWEGYSFGREDAQGNLGVVSLEPGTTDADGRWSAEVPVPPALADASQPVEASFVLSVREGAGRPVERSETRLVMPRRPVIGVRPQFEDGSVAEGAEASFDVVALGPDLRPVASTANWAINRVETDYQWYAIGGEWSWEPVTSRSRIASGEVALTADGPAQVAATVPWGEFELVVTTPDGAETATAFWSGWGAASSGTDTPDRLQVRLDKPAYRAGDTARVTMDAAADGTAIVSVLSNRVISMQAVPVTAGQNSVDLPVTDEWGAGAYVTVSAIRPLGSAADAAGSTHAPIRAMGLAHAGVDPGARRLTASLSAPAETRPRGEATVQLAVQGAAPGETVHATLAAVDQGILNLTRTTPPDPAGHYFGQQRLGVGLRDIYGRLILPSGASAGAIRSGGSEAGPTQSAPPPTEKLMAWFSGPLTVGPDGTVSVQVPLPDFNGEVRLMAVVWSAAGVGQADATMLVRDPVVVTVTAPAFLAPGDRAEVGLTLAHTSGPAGAVGLTAETAGDGPALTLAGLAPSVTLAEQGRGEAGLTITAPEAEGVSNLRLSAALPDGQTVTKDLSIIVTRQDPRISRAARITLQPGETQTLDPAAALGAFLPGTGSATLTSGAFAQLDLAAALSRIMAYPYGCTEQLASGAMPLLYMSDLARTVGAGLPQTDADDRDVGRAVTQILTRQTGSGAFGLWQADGGDPWLDAFATDFLSRARSAGNPVPDEAFRLALTRLQNNLNAAGDPQYATAEDNAATAYAAYVLARERAAVISDLRYYADTAGDAFATPMAAAQLGAALAAYGDVARADAMFRRAQAMLDSPPAADDDARYRADYGSRLRDTAATLTLAAEAGTEVIDRTAAATTVAGLVADRQARDHNLSTQEGLWIVLAGHALQSASDAGNGLTLGGTPVAQPLIQMGDPAGIGPLSLTNDGARPLDVTLTGTAVPAESPTAGGNGWSITRRYYTPEGEALDPTTVAQGTRLVAVLEVTPLGSAGGRLVVTDPLPAGFEIDNPNLIAGGETGGLDWLETRTDTAMTEFRQDRFSAAVTLDEAEAFTLAYRVRAVSPGSFAHPAATVEDMYRPDRRGWTGSGRVEVTR